MSVLETEHVVDTFSEKKNNGLFCFDIPSEDSDVILVVEELHLHVNKAILSYASPVFHRMFHGEFREKSSKEISLPGKSYHDVVAFLLCLYPNTLDEISDKNIEAVLALAHEYMVESLTKKCDAFLNKKLPPNKMISNTELVYLLVLADKFNLEQSLKTFVELAVCRPYAHLKDKSGFSQISDRTKVEILSRRTYDMEAPALVFVDAVSELVKAMPRPYKCTNHMTLANPKQYCTRHDCPHSFSSLKFSRKAELLADFKCYLERFISMFDNKEMQ